tara:strand:- start:141 stop:422 length:282 start_codon:yes stop_codon:yes gene_type:complete
LVKTKKINDAMKITKNSPLSNKQLEQINDKIIKLGFFLSAIIFKEKLMNNKYKKTCRLADEIKPLHSINSGKKANIVDPSRDKFLLKKILHKL